MPALLSTCHFADSLLQFYNISLSFNTLAYDVNTAEYFMGESGYGPEQADALDSINLSGIHSVEIKKTLLRLCMNAANWIRAGKKPNGQKNDEALKIL